MEKLSRHFTEGSNKVYSVAGALGGGFFSAKLLTVTTGIWSFMTVESMVKGVIGIVLAGITGLVTKAGADLWSDHIKPKLKFLKDDRQEKDRAA